MLIETGLLKLVWEWWRRRLQENAEKRRRRM